jgi:hypothetical protein
VKTLIALLALSFSTTFFSQTRPTLPKPGELAQSAAGRALGVERFSPDLQSLFTAQKRVAATEELMSSKSLAPYGPNQADADPILSVLVTTGDGFDSGSLMLVAGAVIEPVGCGYVVSARLSALSSGHRCRKRCRDLSPRREKSPSIGIGRD